MFAENIKKLRKEKWLSQEEMAAKLNVVGRTYGSWESNEREPDFSTLCKIADFFNVSTDYILGRVPMNIEVKKEAPPDLPEGMRDIQLVIPDNASPEQLDAKFEAAVRGQQGSASHSQPAKRRADDAQRGSALLCYILHTIHLVKIL